MKSEELAGALLTPALVVAAFLVVAPWANEVPKAIPFELASRDWRFGALGLVLGSSALPVAGIALAIIASTMAYRIRLAAGFSAFAIVLAVVVVGLTVVFGFDGSVVRRQAPMAQRALYDAGFWRTVGVGGGAGLVLLALGLGGVGAARLGKKNSA